MRLPQMDRQDANEFGMLAVTLGFLTREQLRALLDEQRRLRLAGVERRFGELCLEQGLLTTDQVLTVLRAQGKHILTCGQCQKGYNIHGYRSGLKYWCRHCGGPLAEPKGKIVPRVEDSIGPVPKRKESRPPRSSVDPSLRMLLPGYEIVDLLGRGGMGAVYKARDLILKRDVAVKILASDLAKDEEYVRRFIREARLAQRLRHPNIVEAYDCGIAGHSIFFLMEFVDGETVEDLLKRKGRISEARALHYARQAAEALDYAWGRKILHRDIKPQNLLLTRQGKVKLCDLGLSKQYGSDYTVTITGQINCTPAYASPEQGRGLRDLDCRSDVYSLGCTLYQMLTGEIPFTGEGPGDLILKHSTAPRPDPRERIRSISRDVADLAMSMMAVDPEERPMPEEVVRLARNRVGKREFSDNSTRIRRL